MANSSVLLLKGKQVNLTVEQAWFNGTGIQQCLKESRKETLEYLVAEVGRLIKIADMKKTLADEDEIIFCVQSIIRECPTLKLEEIRIIFDYILTGKYGKLFERLKTAEILDYIRMYEGEQRAEVMERKNHNQKFQEEVPRKLEPLNLASLVKDSPKPKGSGIGSRLKAHLDEYAEYDESILELYNDKTQTEGESG